MISGAIGFFIAAKNQVVEPQKMKTILDSIDYSKKHLKLDLEKDVVDRHLIVQTENEVRKNIKYVNDVPTHLDYLIFFIR